VRRNAENLLVLSGQKPPRVWSHPVPLRDVVRAAIAETEDLDRVAYEIPEGPLVDGASVTDLTHLLAELTENAVRFSPPDMAVTIRGRRDPRGGRGQLLTVEDWGVGMEDEDLVGANALLSDPPEIDLSISKRLGFHVVARLAARHGIRVALSPTPGAGVTASITLPGTLFEFGPEPVGAVTPTGALGAAARPGHLARGGERPERTAPDPAAARRRPTPASCSILVPEPAAEPDPLDEPRLPGRLAMLNRPIPVPKAAAEPNPQDEPRPAGRPRFGRASEDAPGTPVETTQRISLAEQLDDRRPEAPRRTVAVPTPQMPADAPRPALRRRVPQTHLATGLRVIPPRSAPADSPSLPVAAEALSRYQASRAAAQSLVHDDPAEEGSG
jgi:hypothetical protein